MPLSRHFYIINVVGHYMATRNTKFENKNTLLTIGPSSSPQGPRVGGMGGISLPLESWGDAPP